MIAEPPDHTVRPRECLVVAQRCACIASTLKACERKNRDTVIKRILRRSCNSCHASYIHLVLIEVAELRVAAVVVEVEIIR